MQPWRRGAYLLGEMTEVVAPEGEGFVRAVQQVTPRSFQALVLAGVEQVPAVLGAARHRRFGLRVLMATTATYRSRRAAIVRIDRGRLFSN